MTSLTRDPLLAAAKILLYLLMGGIGLGAAACVVAVPAVIVMHAEVAGELLREMPSLQIEHIIPAICTVLLFAAALLGAVFLMLLLLKRIVDTVGEGDPFVPQNAVRLTRMAWLALGVQILTVPLVGIGLWLARVVGEKGADVHAEGGLSGNGLLLVLVLFILARVFRKGAEMRAELEGTV